MMGVVRSSFCVSCVGLMLFVGCQGSDSAPGATGAQGPVVADIENTDPEVAELIRGLIEAARKAPLEAEHRAALGMAYEVAGMFRAALQSYRQAVELDPDEPRYTYYAAQTLGELGDLEEALAALDRLNRLDDSYVPAWLYRGQWLLDLGRTDEAMVAYERALELQPDHYAAEVGRARVHLRRKEGAPAARILEPVVQRYPREPYFRQLLGLAYREAGDLERARAALANSAPQRGPGWSDPWHDRKQQYQTGFGVRLMRAGTMMQRGKMDEAIQLMEELRAERPNDVALLNNLSVAYRNKSQPDKAFEVLKAGLEGNPEYFPFHFNIAADYQRLGQYDRALTHLDRTLEINPTLAAAYERKGMLLLALKRLPEARETFLTALDNGAGGATIYLYVGVVEGELGRWEAAAEYLEQAIRLSPDYPAAFIALARARAELGDFDDADRALARATELAPDSTRLQQTRERVESLRAGSS